MLHPSRLKPVTAAVTAAVPKHALGEFEGSLAKALECPIATREFFVAIVVCSSSIGADGTNEIERMALYDVFLPGLGRTIETDKYRYELFVGIDDDDAAYTDAENQRKLHRLAAEYNVSMQIHAFPSVKDRIPWNDILAVAREAGADYFVRLNDDTELVTEGWTGLGIATLASYDPPNVGVVGPVDITYLEEVDKGCSMSMSCGLDLLQHDMVHARHMEIFDGKYYPPSFPNVMVDDWISQVYGVERTTKLKDWVVDHKRNKQGRRYGPHRIPHQEFFEEVKEGALKVNKWLEKTGKTVVVRGEYDGLVDFESTEHIFSVVILTMNRPDSLCRLLSSLEATDFDGDNVRLVIKIDHSENSMGVGHLAQSFAFSHGHVRVEFSTQNKGLRQSWLDAWTHHPESFSNHSTGSSLGIILEDDVELSPLWYIWLKGGWKAYLDRTDIAGISLQRQTLVPQQPYKHMEIVNNHEPFLFKLVGSIGFSPHPQRWQEFLEWVAEKDLENFDASVDGLITSEWYATQDKRSMWTQLFIRFCNERSLYTLYVNLPNGKTLGGHWREKGEHVKEGLGLDFALATDAEMPWLEFPENLARYGWNGQEERESKWHVVAVISSSMVDFARNWWLSLSPFVVPANHNVTIIALSEGICDHFDDPLLLCEVADRTSKDDTEKIVTWNSEEYKSNILRRISEYSLALGKVDEGDMVIFSDVDLVFLSSPFSQQFGDSDMSFTYAAESCRDSRVNGGYYVLRNSQEARDFLLDAEEETKKEKDFNDQIAINSILDKGHFKYDMLPCDKFCNGNVFWGKDIATPHPVMVHANWIATSDVKMDCLRASNLWPVQEEGQVIPVVEATMGEDGNNIVACSKGF